MYQSCKGMKLQKFLLTHLFTIFLKKATLRTGRHFQFYWKQRWLFRIVPICSILYLPHFAFCPRTLSPMTHVKVSKN